MADPFDELSQELDALRTKREALEGRSTEASKTKPLTIQEAVQRALEEEIGREKKRIERLEKTPNHPERRKAQGLLRRLTPEETQRVIDVMQRIIADRDT